MSLHDSLLAKAFCGGGSGGASSWNELTDKPFGEEAVQIIWKSATDVTDYVTPHSQRNVFYKITDEVFDISDLDGAYFIVDMGNGSTTKVDLNNVKEIEGGCSQGNAFCSIYDTIVNLGIASDGKPDTFPSTGTYLGMSRPYDVQIVIPKRIKKIDDKYLPAIDGGSSSIDVTAQVGQTIIVKEVDASGKPTKWESADYQPRMLWSEEGIGTLIPHTVFKPILNSTLQMPIYTLPEFGLAVGKTYTVVYDGVEYSCTAVSGTFQGLDFVSIGNTYLANGTQTSEPFIVAKIPYLGATIVVDLIGGENHTIEIYGEKTVYHKPAPEYASNEYWVSFLETGVVDEEGNLIYHFNADWDELIAAIKARKNIYADLVSSRNEGSFYRQRYMLGFARIGYTPTEDFQYTDILMFGVCHNNVNETIGRTTYVMRWADGTVTVSDTQINVQPT
jgi:hypothetical protein